MYCKATLIHGCAAVLLTCVSLCPVLPPSPAQMCELLMAGLPLKSDAVESQKVNDLLVRMAEVSP